MTSGHDAAARALAYHHHGTVHSSGGWGATAWVWPLVMVCCLEQIEKQTADQRAQRIAQYPHQDTGGDLIMPSLCCGHSLGPSVAK